MSQFDSSTFCEFSVILNACLVVVVKIITCANILYFNLLNQFWTVFNYVFKFRIGNGTVFVDVWFIINLSINEIFDNILQQKYWPFWARMCTMCYGILFIEYRYNIWYRNTQYEEKLKFVQLLWGFSITLKLLNYLYQCMNIKYLSKYGYEISFIQIRDFQIFFINFWKHIIFKKKLTKYECSLIKFMCKLITSLYTDMIKVNSQINQMFQDKM